MAEKKELENTLLKKAREILRLAGEEIPEGGHVSLYACKDHVSATIYTGPAIKDPVWVLNCWADPRKPRMEVHRA